MAITIYYLPAQNRSRVALRGSRNRASAGSAPDQPLYVRVREKGKYRWQKRLSELAAKGAAKSAPVERKAQALGLVPDDVTGEVNPSRTPIKVAVESYLNERRFGRPRSIAAYENIFDQLLTNLPAGVRFIDQLATPRALDAYVEFLRGEGYSNKTISTRMGFVFSLLKANGVERSSRLIKLPKVQRTKPKAYSSVELGKLFAAMTPEEYFRYLFFLRTGCREQEVQHAAWRDVDLKNLALSAPSSQDSGDELAPMPTPAPRFMYIENKSAQPPGQKGVQGPARIGRVTFSKTGKTLYYWMRRFQRPFVCIVTC